MKRAHKKVLGIFGLLIVVVMTCVAIMMPSSKTSAITSVTDTIVVRVVGSAPNVDIRGITNGAIYANPIRDFAVDYENVDDVTVTIEYTNLDGATISEVIDRFNPNYEPGTENYSIRSTDYGYGKYVIKVKGAGDADAYDEDLVMFYYLPIYAEIVEDEENNTYYVDLDYTADDGTPESEGEVARIVLNVYDSDGNLVAELSPITVYPPTTRVEIPIADTDLPSGEYTVEVIAYNADGEQLYEPYILKFYYEVVAVPDTGALFGNLNISKTDYLITGLLIFLSAAGLGIAFVMKNRNSRARLGRKHR